MNRELALKVANAILYEGYMLYPYRPSAIKNRQRWSFGILYPPAYEEVKRGTERAHMRSECLLRMTGEAEVKIEIRFLHLLAREVLKSVNGHLEPATSVTVEGRRMESWNEGVERSVEFKVHPCDEVEQFFQFGFDGLDRTEALRDATHHLVADVVRSQDALEGTLLVGSRLLRSDLMKLTIEIANATPLPAYASDRESALMSSLLSAHTILTVTGGEFVSLLDPSDDLRAEAAACSNLGNFPVLIGNQGECDTMLCSPILLYDYPQVAPESAGDFYDATEMDEMLTLRVMTLTDGEKNEVRQGDEHARNLLERTEASAREQLMRTHGTIRGMRQASES